MKKLLMIAAFLGMGWFSTALAQETKKDSKQEVKSERKEQKDAVDQKIAESSKKEDPDEKREEQQQIINDINDLFNKRNTAK